MSTIQTPTSVGLTNISLYFLPGVYALAMAPQFFNILTLSRHGWSNVSPRLNFENLKSTLPPATHDRALRLHAAHLNALENFPLFAAAVVAGIAAGLPAEEMNKMVYAYVGARVLYTAAYAGIKNEVLSYARTGFWGMGTALVLWGIVRAGLKINGEL